MKTVVLVLVGVLFVGVFTIVEVKLGHSTHVSLVREAYNLAVSMPCFEVRESPGDEEARLLLETVMVLNGRSERELEPVLQRNAAALGDASAFRVYTSNDAHQYTHSALLVDINVKELCSPYVKTLDWKRAVIFRTFKVLFEALLKDFPEKRYFLILEDDALILNATLLRHQVYGAMASPSAKNAHFFYFLYNWRRDDCLYRYGMQAFIISRAYMEDLLRVDTHFICKVPIDLYIGRERAFSQTPLSIFEHHAKSSARLRYRPNRRSLNIRAN